ncbi:sensor domain-containing diguanylate cyclase [Acuticoccus kandeliae]|uniref:sensor domain-containing diguanylate cyclase n=1 Tax=Acuticoccus kandeliae TaxID=2073160 RepID=UPI000D3E198A|nr:sensor domain-containing diguanylate cyclase [Acuticoccus kandeliae]
MLDEISDAIRSLDQSAPSLAGDSADHPFAHILDTLKIMLNAPVAGVSVIESSKYGFSAAPGRAALTVSTEPTPELCLETIKRRDPLLIEDLRAFRDGSSAVGAPPMRAYAGVPLLGYGEAPLGILWAMDTRPRTFDGPSITVLQNLARCVVHELLLRERAELDDLTHLLRRRPFMGRLRVMVDDFQRRTSPAVLAIFDLDFFKSVNDRFGHQAGDAVLARVAKLCRDKLGPDVATARLGGEEFAAAFHETSVGDATARLRELRNALAEMRFPDLPGLSITASFGVCGLSDTVVNASVWCKMADAALYGAKAAGRNQILVYHPTTAVAADEDVTPVGDPVRTGTFARHLRGAA